MTHAPTPDAWLQTGKQGRNMGKVPGGSLKAYNLLGNGVPFLLHALDRLQALKFEFGTRIDFLPSFSRMRAHALSMNSYMLPAALAGVLCMTMDRYMAFYKHSFGK
ncbi:hypothetical protein T440DRAFT_221737 [Plenodomus tracheiphilus IPT5]|uniref:Uncharacterized protein n=1 Tax=Plenodomus tracheiphilus IPT5 TaxID=1408161 RepID=A0A6A7AWF1_9PLEO|nr:hypothetical protein T440DRAFT_221737 [Plenodomus tracheiphilus IPT5]